jgi:hypothetical protein
MAVTSPALAASGGRGPEQPREDERQQRDVGGGDHRPGGGQPRADICPGRYLPGFQLLAEEVGVFLGGPVHQQRDQDGDRQRKGGQVVSGGGQDRRGDDRAVDAGGVSS